MLIQYIAEYLEYLQAERGLAQNTIDAYRRDLSDFCNYILNLDNIDDFEKIKRTHINYYIKQLHDKNYSPTSLTRKLAAIRGWFKWLNANEIIKIDPSTGIELPRLTKKLPKVMSVAEIDRILANHIDETEAVMLEL